MSLTPSQVKMARAALDWSREQLSEVSGISVPAIRELEAGRVQARTSTIEPIRRAFEQSGIDFIKGGVRERQDTIRIIEDDAITHLFDDIIVELRNSSDKELLIFGVDEKKFLSNFPEDKLLTHIQQRKQLGITQRLLLCEGDTNFVGSSETYRWTPKEYFSVTPTFVYGNKVATILWEAPPKVFIVHNDMYANERRRNFSMSWKAALIPTTATDVKK